MSIFRSAQAAGCGTKQTTNSADLAAAGESVVREFLGSLAFLHDNGQLKQLRLGYCDQYDFPLPEQHKFPLRKYSLLREYLRGDTRFRLEAAPLATPEAVCAVHTAGYVDAFLQGTLEQSVMRRIGFPWSPELVTRTLASAGSTLQAVQNALDEGLSGTLAGGTHHAFRDAGAGFCVFNDLAIAIAWARRERLIKKIAVIDLDVHQGDGTASIFSGDPAVFTLSVHGSGNFPFRKQESTLDVELEDGATDGDYLQMVAAAVARVWEFRPQLVLYQAGVDGLKSDRLGRLALTVEGLRQRDRLVIEEANRRSIPLAITIGGGYSDPISETVRAHAQTFEVAADTYC